MPLQIDTFVSATRVEENYDRFIRISFTAFTEEYKQNSVTESWITKQEAIQLIKMLSDSIETAENITAKRIAEARKLLESVDNNE